MSSKIETILDRAMKTGKEIEQRKTAKRIENEQAVAAVTETTAEMERAALAGDEEAYKVAKDRRNDAETKLEILRIRNRKSPDREDLDRKTAEALQALETDATAEIRNMCRDFLEKYEQLLPIINAIDKYSTEFCKVHEYYKAHVLRSTEYRYAAMAELLPIVHVLSFRDKFKYQRQQIAEAVKR